MLSDLDLALTIGAGTVLVLGIVGGFVKNRLWISEPTICLLAGVLVGPVGMHAVSLTRNGIDPLPWLEQAAHLTLGIAVMGAALRLPSGFWRTHARDMVVALCIGLPLMALTGAALAYWILGAAVLPALMLGAILGPTDPVLAATITGGRLAEQTLPVRMRNVLTAESGANDGLGQLLVMLPVLLATEEMTTALWDWSLRVVLWEVVGAVAIGAACGTIAARLLMWSRKQPFADDHSITTVGLALSITVLSFVRLIGSDGILAVFVAGLILNRHIDSAETLHEHTQEAIGRFFNLPAFILFGAMLPWGAWIDLGWKGVGFVAAVLLLRRLPLWLLLRPALPAVASWREAAFIGWFGPMGIASMYYALLVVHETEIAWLWPVASLTVASSIVAHGITATPLAVRAGRRLSPPEE